MSEAEHARLAEIDKELESLHGTPHFVDNYVRMLAVYPDPATTPPSHNGIMLMLPQGTIPHAAYMETLHKLIRDIEQAEEFAKDIPNIIKLCEDSHGHMKKLKTFSNPSQERAFDLQLTQQVQEYRKQLCKPCEVQRELYDHLTKFKPINAKTFYDTLNALIKEKMRILANIRITEVTMMQKVEHME